MHFKATRSSIRKSTLVLLSAALVTSMAMAAPIESKPPKNHAQCEGYTGGGGQRVRGEVTVNKKVTWSDDVQGYYIRYQIGIEASNWKKNFGWNTKRTNQLAIQGWLENVPCYGFTPYCSNVLNAAVTTGGKLKTRIGIGWESDVLGPVSDPDYFDFTLYPYLDFYGRHGTHCKLTP